MTKHFTSYIFNTENVQDCSGCSACVHMCHKDALTMQYDNEGFLYPKIDTGLCVQCGICDRGCPIQQSGHFNNQYDDQKGYLVTNVNPQDSKDKATIGLCSMISEWAYSKGWKVFGVYLDEVSWKTFHKEAASIDDIKSFQNSKYIQSNVNTTSIQVLQNLKAGDNVLFIGTPCQIAGLKAYLRKDYPNLYTIDLICHGAYSYKLIREEVKHWESKFRGRVKNLRFRSKHKYPWNIGGIINFDVVTGSDNRHIEIPGPASPTYRSFAYSGDGINYNLRPACYTCPFRDRGRYGDLTIGDAWNMDKINHDVFTSTNMKSGISLVLCNSSKAQILIGAVTERINLYEISTDDAFCQEALLTTDRKIPPLRAELYSCLGTEEYGSLIERLLHVDLDAELRCEQKRQIRRKIKNTIKTLIGYNLWHKINAT